MLQTFIMLSQTRLEILLANIAVKNLGVQLDHRSAEPLTAEAFQA